MKLVSLTLLAYKRPEMLIDCLKSIHETADMPFELIVNCDARSEVEELALELYDDNRISKLILSNGNNRGVGRSFQNCLGMCEGDYVFKIDCDVIFSPHWLSTSISILDTHSDVATVNLFNYRHYKDDDLRFNIIEERKDCYIVDDFVSSCYVFRKNDFPYKLFQTVPDDGIHQKLGGKLAITKQDYVTNQGFGINSVYVTTEKDGTQHKTVTFDKPLTFCDSI